MPMELKDKDDVGSDDEEDLEKLRLAALQSLKRPPAVPNAFKKSPQGMKRRNFGRNRNGQFRIKNTNLIAIPTVDDTTAIANHQKGKDETKLVLPQDRYCNNARKDADERAGSTSKFDRYDNSDKSESESEYESETGSEAGGKLERANSLEALMQELENEIQGNSQPKPDAAEHKKKVRKRKKKGEVKATSDAEGVEPKPAGTERVDPQAANEAGEAETKAADSNSAAKLNFFRKKSPLNRATRNYPKFDRKSRAVSYQNHYTPPLNYTVPLPYSAPILYNPIAYAPPPAIAAQIPTPDVHHHRAYYDRPLSPLILNSDDALTIARAPLSPRSAAFVLQNRDAIERRKKSPRRSYSRSPSPLRYHRSKSKERSPPKFAKSRSRTPLKDERRSTPAKEPRRRSPVARRRSVERKSPESSVKKKLVRERLGNKKKRSRSLSPIPTTAKIAKIDDEKLDPILEARKKKFETNEIKNKEGIIRLKPKSEENRVVEKEDKKTEKITEQISETLLDDLEENIDDILNAKVDDIFSDEETDEENEGRFKDSIDGDKKRNMAVVPFSKLLDNAKGAKTNLPTNETGNRKDRLRSPLRSKDAKNYNSETRSDNAKLKGGETNGKNEHKERPTVRRSKPERKEKLVPPIESKKIEIKIRNPSKYETISKYDVANKAEAKERGAEKSSRKVEVSAKKSDDDELDTLEPKLILDAEEDDVLFNQKCDSGDLRAQLSRKRAERQNRLPVPENVPSRLLQNALQGAVFKKQKKTKAENESAPKDSKMPIHLRLGVTNADAYQENKTKKSAGKSKGRVDQV